MDTPTLSVEILRTLHRIHHQLGDLQHRLDRGPKQIAAAEANVTNRQGIVEQAKAEEKAFRVTLDQMQLNLKSAEAKIKDLDVKRNQAQSNKEYQLLAEQIQAAEMANSVLADEILEAFDKAEQLKKDVALTETELSAAKQRLSEVQAEVAKAQPGLQAEADRLQKELNDSEATLPEEIRDPYCRLVRQRGEDGLAVVENQSCGGCFTQVPLNVCNQIMLNQPVFCKSCGRMLYLPENAMPLRRGPSLDE